MKDWAVNFYTGKRWKKCRAGYIAKRILIDGGICEECKERPGFIVHHKIKLDEIKVNDPEISLNTELLEYVCKDCHDKFEGHFLSERSKKSKKNIERTAFFDADGDLSPPVR